MDQQPAINMAPIQPARLVLNSIQLEPNPQYQPAPERWAFVQLNVSAGMLRVRNGTTEGGPEALRCDVEVRIREDVPLISVPYLGKAAAVGFFIRPVPENLDDNSFKRWVAFSGLAMVYGFIRDAMLQVSALSVFGPLTLPALDLTPLADQLAARPAKLFDDFVAEQQAHSPVAVWQSDKSAQPVSSPSPRKRKIARSDIS